ncbi:MAG TPA: DUF2271 domain-containing protein [Hyphomicrobiales bacterium]|nr:DUF2271 domain-containing protein [Hyphomicrobiales bacterium]
MTDERKAWRRAALLGLGLACGAAHGADDAVSLHYDGVLGTSLDLTLYGVAREPAEAASAAALTEIARLDAILSSYRDDSELMRLNRSHASSAASTELLDVVELCETWLRRSEERFSCRLGSLIAHWREAETEQAIPDRPTLRHEARAIAEGSVTVARQSGSVQMDPAIALETSGLAKGYVIDRALAVLREQLPQAVAIKLDIGGDAAYWGSPPGAAGWEVGIADPVHTADNGNYLGRIVLRDAAIAASGHFSRTRDIGRRQFSHILNPRDGWPVEGGSAAVVVAADAATADAVATALAVRSLSEGLAWVETLEGVQALLIDQDGRQLMTPGWPALPSSDAPEGAATALDFQFSFALPQVEATNYARPYVAIWISDLEQQPLKNLLLLGESERWARENSRWWRRVGRRDPALLDGVARPTRGPGEYQLQWDGRDDFGKPVPAGEYLLHVEVSREHGGSTYRSVAFTLGGAPTVLDLAPEGESGVLHLNIK